MNVSNTDLTELAQWTPLTLRPTNIRTHTGVKPDPLSPKEELNFSIVTNSTHQNNTTLLSQNNAREETPFELQEELQEELPHTSTKSALKEEEERVIDPFGLSFVVHNSFLLDVQAVGLIQ